MIRLSTIVTLSASAVLLSGCSWMPFGQGGQKAHYGAQKHHGGAYGAQAGGAYGGGANPCQIPHAQAPIPQGCDPAMVTVGLNGFSQKPQYGAAVGAGHGAQYASGGYGTHAGAGAYHGQHSAKPEYRRPRFRAQLGLGVEKSIAGNLLDYAKVPGIDPELAYDPTAFNVGGTTSTPASDVTQVYTAVTEEVIKPSISHDDVYSTPASIRAGLEYIMTPRTTVFANAGYTVSEGNSGAAIQINSELQRIESRVNYQTSTDPLTGVVTRDQDALGNDIITSSSGPDVFFRPNIENTANFAYDFTDMRRIDLQAGARHYLNPLKSAGMPKVTPFVGASAGASHYNGVSFEITQNQALYNESYNDASTVGNLYEVFTPGTPRQVVDLYDSQWVPTGALNAGVEWQATPRTAIAFETGVRVDGGRKYSNGNREGESVSIPLTIRGSYNF